MMSMQKAKKRTHTHAHKYRPVRWGLEDEGGTLSATPAQSARTDER